MSNTLFNSLERADDALAVRTHPAKRRKIIQTNLLNSAILIGFGIYTWSEPSIVLIAINSVLCVMTLPLTLFVLWIEWRAGLRTKPGIEIDRSGLRFMAGTIEPVEIHPGEVAQLILMPSTFGQSLLVVPTDEKGFRKRLPASARFYMAMSKLYCGHAIGLTLNLVPEDYREFSQALDRVFPDCISVWQKAHRPPLLARLLGNKAREAPMPVHVPPPLVKSPQAGTFVES